MYVRIASCGALYLHVRHRPSRSFVLHVDAAVAVRCCSCADCIRQILTLLLPPPQSAPSLRCPTRRTWVTIVKTHRKRSALRRQQRSSCRGRLNGRGRVCLSDRIDRLRIEAQPMRLCFVSGRETVVVVVGRELGASRSPNDRHSTEQHNGDKNGQNAPPRPDRPASGSR
jgi:hypothetical protein